MIQKTRSKQPTLNLPKLRRDQWEIASHPAKIKVLAMGRRWGKTTLAGVLALATALIGGKVAWIVPTYKNGRPLWRWAESVVAHLKRAGVRINKSERTITFPSGGFLGIYSADNDVSLRGESFHLVIVDEAARVPQETWTDVIMPTLADYDGDAILISTPIGKNWFYYEWMKGYAEEDGYKSWTAPSSANPSPHIQLAAARAKDRVSERTYTQEWLAEFLDNGGEVFRKVKEAAILKKRKPYEGRFIGGIDWAKENDYTVITVLDRDTHEMVDCDRFNKTDWHLQRDFVKAMYERWHIEKFIVEINSIGDPNFEELWRDGIPVEAFKTTPISKPPLIERLVLAFEKEQLKVLDDPRLIKELSAYERKVSLKTGHTQYNAPEGMHDDFVMSTALAWHGVLYSGPSVMFVDNRELPKQAAIDDPVMRAMQERDLQEDMEDAEGYMNRLG